MNVTATKVASIAKGGQDGAIFKNYLFGFDSRGGCRVYDMSAASTKEELCEIGSFTLGCAELITPHNNAVGFGNEFYSEGDEFPLLYTNVYNNYAKAENKHEGVCCVYRIRRCDKSFCAQLVQLIEIGFTESREYWRSEGDIKDVRPYGNFVIDRERGRYYAFVMRDGNETTRYFAFDLPKATDGALDEKLGVKRVTLSISDIKEYFDTPYHNYIQGACMRDGKIYSLEGFDEKIHPAVRIIDTVEKKQITFHDFCDSGIIDEPELIDFYNDELIFGFHSGNMFKLHIEQ